MIIYQVKNVFHSGFISHFLKFSRKWLNASTAVVTQWPLLSDLSSMPSGWGELCGSAALWFTGGLHTMSQTDSGKVLTQVYMKCVADKWYLNINDDFATRDWFTRQQAYFCPLTGYGAIGMALPIRLFPIVPVWLHIGAPIVQMFIIVKHEETMVLVMAW